MSKTIRLFGFSKNDELVFTSLLSLLSSKTHSDWQMVQSSQAQVTIVDIDKGNAKTILEELGKSGSQLVAYGMGSLSHKLPRLAKPLRAAAILKCLSELERLDDNASVNTEKPVVAIDRAYHLRRWPAPEIMKAVPGSPRISAVLLKEVASVAQLVDRTGLPEDTIKSFVAKCSAAGILIEKERTSTRSVPQARNNALQPLFAKLRAKFSGGL